MQTTKVYTSWILVLSHVLIIPQSSITNDIFSGPQSFSGNLGKLLATDVWLRPVCSFESISSGIEAASPAILRKLSSDSRYLYEICDGINAGHIPDRLAALKIGPLCHSRWTTTENRVLRLFVSGPPPELHYIVSQLAHYIVKVYYPVSQEHYYSHNTNWHI